MRKVSNTASSEIFELATAQIEAFSQRKAMVFHLQHMPLHNLIRVSLAYRTLSSVLP